MNPQINSNKHWNHRTLCYDLVRRSLWNLFSILFNAIVELWKRLLEKLVNSDSTNGATINLDSHRKSWYIMLQIDEVFFEESLLILSNEILETRRSNFRNLSPLAQDTTASQLGCVSCIIKNNAVSWKVLRLDLNQCNFRVMELLLSELYNSNSTQSFSFNLNTNLIL